MSGHLCAASTLALVGPTASGKSTVAFALARRRASEIITCDSVQVYRGFDIGTAKPTGDERREVPHHLIDIVRWDEAFDAAQYARLAGECLTAIKQRQRQAILCGGTGLYLRALRYGLIETPPVDRTLRSRLMDSEAQEPGAMYRQLMALDPSGAAVIAPRNQAHVLRALEICLQTGQPASLLRAQHGFQRSLVPLRVVVLDWPAAVLRTRIAERTQFMLANGLLEETAALLARGVDPACRAMRAVGYREAVLTLQGLLPVRDLATAINKSTWQYARRQRTWWRREKDVEVWPVQSIEAAIERLSAALAASC